MTCRSLSLAYAASALLATVPAYAQRVEQSRSRDCDLQFKGVTVGGVVTTHFESRATSAGQSNVFAGGGVDGVCANSDQHVTADSAEHFGDVRVLYLIGRVHYTEQRLRLDADRITYEMAEERLTAEGNVVGRTSTGTWFRGPKAVYLRAKPGLRDRSRLDAGGRPDVWISGSDAGTTSEDADSVHVLADSVISDNDSLVYARGKVVIDRPDLAATADSAMMDQGREIASLRMTPKVVGRGGSEFTLEGAEIDIYSTNRKAERVRSAGAATATSDEMKLDADTIDLRFAEQQLSRAVAWGPGRAHAAQSGRDITADSIDVEMPRQMLQRIYAVRKARAESLPDSNKIRSRERDWFAGDTIVAEFDAPAPSDSASQAVLTRLISSGSALSWQQTARSGVAVPDSMPVINYMGGRIITVDFSPDRALERVRVVGAVSGLLVQPASDTTKRPPPPKKPDAPRNLPDHPDHR